MTSKLQGYSTIGTNNKEAAEAFYDGLLTQINASKFPAKDRITMWMSEDGSKVILAIAIPYDGKTASHGNGTMKAIPLDSHEAVDAMYAKAIELGATDDGEPLILKNPEHDASKVYTSIIDKMTTILDK